MSMLITANTHGALYARHPFGKRIGWPLGIVLMALVMGTVLSAPDQVWKFYIVPGDALLRIVSGCSAAGHDSYGLQMANWRDAHSITASNPYQRERDESIQSCVKADGWCVYSGAGAPGVIGALSFAPLDRTAKWLYEFRYRAGVHWECL
jgi:hypothetical protein